MLQIKIQCYVVRVANSCRVRRRLALMLFAVCSVFVVLRPLFAIAQEQQGLPTETEKQISANSSEMFDTIRLALTSNREKLGAIRLELEIVSLDGTIQEVTSEDVKLPDGSIFTITRSPSRKETASVFLDVDTLLYRFRDIHGDVERSLHLANGVWREGSNQGKRRKTTIRRPDQMPGILPLDPREIVGDDIRISLSELIEQNELIEVTGTEKTGRNVWQVSMRDDVGITYWFDFDENVGLMPVRGVSRTIGGGIILDCTAEYEKVESRNAWLLKRAVRTYFPLGAKDLSQGSNKTSTIHVVEFELIDSKTLSAASVEDFPETAFIENHAIQTDKDRLTSP